MGGPGARPCRDSQVTVGWVFGLGWAVFPLFLITGHLCPQEPVASGTMFPYRVVSNSLICVSVLFLLVVGVCPCWLLFRSEMGFVHFGIWTVCKDTTCKNLPPRTGVLDASRGFMLVGIIAAFFAALCCLDSFRRYASKFFPETNVSAMACFTAGTCGLISSVTFLIFELNAPQHPQIRRSYNWAFYVSWAVGPAFVIAVCAGLVERLNFKLVTKLLSCLSLLMQLLALVTPYWMELGIPGFETNMGLWNMCINWSCSKLPMGTVAFEVAKALVTLSTLLGFLAVCSVFTSFHTFRKYKLAAITNILTGILMLTGILVFAVSFSSIAEAFHTKMKPQRIWSFHIGCVASLLFLLSGLVSLLAHINSPETPPQSVSQVTPQERSLQPGPTAQTQQHQPRPEPPAPV